MKPQSVFINTIGCQMNVYDSDRIVRALEPAGYRQTATLEGANLVIVNTCAIRAKAEQKAFSFLGRLARLKREDPELLIGVGGCVAQQEGEAILSRMPHVDMVFGTHAIPRLSQIVTRVKTRRTRVVDVDQSETIHEMDPVAGFHDDGQISRFVTIMQGCDNYCTYCVVPHVRGPEMSRHPDRILAEIETLVDGGVREITLLGQNVNSFGLKEGLPSFAELLARVNAIDGLQRIRFTTSHPKDLSDDLMEAFGNLEKLCPHIHLPVQSGSDRILKRMNRKYTREHYLERIARLRAVRPDIAVTSDFIVGFPGESREDFQDTLSLLAAAAFDGIFAFMYSDREIAAASRFRSKIDENEKKERLQELLAAQEKITMRKNRALEGTLQEVLVEGESARPGLADAVYPGPQWTGRTPGNKIVNFTAGRPENRQMRLRVGQTVDVCIEKAHAHSLRGVLNRDASPNCGSKRNDCHAA